MLKRFKLLFSGMAGLILLLNMTGISLASVPAGTSQVTSPRQSDELTQRVRHALLMLPYYSVFDEVTFSIDGNTVILNGEVRRALLKVEAENAVGSTGGVAKVVNNIEVLPLSPMDDSIRLRTYYAIFSMPGFEKYAIQVNSPIRIIVKNGHITLGGVVLTPLDKTAAEIAARNVPFVFSVTNNLTVG
jgi:hyperosmotically inducible protein